MRLARSARYPIACFALPCLPDLGKSHVYAYEHEMLRRAYERINALLRLGA